MFRTNFVTFYSAFKWGNRKKYTEREYCICKSIYSTPIVCVVTVADSRNGIPKQNQFTRHCVAVVQISIRNTAKETRRRKQLARKLILATHLREIHKSHSVSYSTYFSPTDVLLYLKKKIVSLQLSRGFLPIKKKYDFERSTDSFYERQLVMHLMFLRVSFTINVRCCMFTISYPHWLNVRAYFVRVNT